MEGHSLFTTVSQSASGSPTLATSNGTAAASDHSTGRSSYVPRPKRIACVVCRRRKLKCDSQRPSCGNCTRLGHDCAYDEVRKKSGPKRGYVKQLEARLAQVETLLRSQEPNTVRTQPMQSQENALVIPTLNQSTAPEIPEISDIPMLNEIENLIPPLPELPQLDQTYIPGPDLGVTGDFQWEMIGLGLEEPLPRQDVIDELDQIYFEKINTSMPLIHRPRYFMAMNLAFNMRPPICLRYIMWCHAAMVTDKYLFLHEHFYQRARKYAEMDEMKGFGEGVISLAHCQCWLLIGTYEFKRMYFPRAWLTVGKAARLALMMGFNRLDAVGLDMKHTLPPPKDWTEREERRRAFWMAFCADRYASIGTGWPMVFDERDIMTSLPATEESFIKSKPQRTLRLADVMLGNGISTLSPFGSVVLLASLLGRNLTHLHRPDAHDNDHDLNGEFWKRHRAYDNILLNIALSLPSHLRLPAGIGDPNVVFCNLAIHTATICLHQAAVFKAEKNKLPNQIVTESKRRCIVAADQISSIMKIISHMDLSGMNPFMAFCVYTAARVFVQYLKSRPHDSTVRSSLEFILNALNVLKSRNPLAESFLVQLDVDIEGTGLRFDKPTNRPATFSTGFCNMTIVEGCESTTVYQSQRLGVAAQSPLQDITLSDPSNSSRPRSNVSPAASLPVQQMQAGMQQSNQTATANRNDISEFINAPHNPNLGTTLEIGFSPELRVSERDTTNNSPSDHPTPSTFNSSSITNNTSSSNLRANQPSSSSNTSQDPEPSSREGLDPLHLAGIPCPYARLGYKGAQELVPNSTGSGVDLPVLSSGWDSSVVQAPDLENINNTTTTTPGEMDNATATQWAQILSEANWENWRTL